MSLLPLQSTFHVCGLALHWVWAKFEIAEFDLFVCPPGVMQSTTEPPSEWHKWVVVWLKLPNFKPLGSLLRTWLHFCPVKVAWVNKVLAFLPKTLWHSLLLDIPNKSMTAVNVPP